MARSLFPSPGIFSHIQRSSISLHTAKGHIYGSTFFGKKAYYGDEFDFKKQPLHPHDRRKIRFGLKGLVDFIIQLDLENLKACLYEDDANVKNFTQNLSVQQDSEIPPNSCMGLINRTNPSKVIVIKQILDRITSNLNFTQSMGEFLASDGPIETTKMVVTEAVKRGPNLGDFLRGGPFASCAQIYRNLSSKFDFDAAFFLALKQSNFDKPQANKSPRNFGQPRFQKGYCFSFQKTGICNNTPCTFKHACSDCDSKYHGADECRMKKPKNSEKNRSESEKRPRARLPFKPNKS